MLRPENIVYPHGVATKLEPQRVAFDMKFLRILARSYKLCHVLRIYMETGKPIIFQFLLERSTESPLKNSYIELWVAPIVETAHSCIV